NQAPSGTEQTVNENEDVALTIKLSDFGFSDPDSPPNTPQAVLITNASTLNSGTLTLNGNPIVLGAIPVNVAASDILAGALKYKAPANQSGANFARIVFQVQDNGGTDLGGQNTDQSAHTPTVSVPPVNDAPRGASFARTIAEDSAGQPFAPGDFGFTDTLDSGLAATMTGLVITSLPTGGTLKLNGVNVTQGQVIAVSGGANGTFTLGALTFVPNLDFNGTAAFNFQVQDGGGTATTTASDNGTATGADSDVPTVIPP